MQLPGGNAPKGRGPKVSGTSCPPDSLSNDFIAISARLHRLRAILHREALQRRLPHGLVSWRYLWPGQDQRIRLHRHFWWASGNHWPRPVWLMVEAWLWLRWQLWHAVPACWRAIRKLGPVIEAQEGIPRRVQGARILKLALLWSISPWDSYRFRLYRHPGKALDYVYDSETQAYHTWRSRKLGFSSESLHLLQDKAEFHRVMAEHGIPTVPTLAKIARHGKDPAPLLQALNQTDRVFCKMNSGNQGRGAFAAWRTAAGLSGRAFSGQRLANTEHVLAAWRALLPLDDALIQPCLNNHPDLAPLAYNEDAITVRYISQWADQVGEDPAPTRLTCLSATLEVPAGIGDKGHTYYAILPIQPEGGNLTAPIRPLTDDPAVQRALARIAAQGAQGAPLPGWAGVIEASHRAHCLFPDVQAIAWDWVITPSGPVLLEGNTGWATTVPQRCLQTGLVALHGLCQGSSLR